jgi:hypothetical protein
MRSTLPGVAARLVDVGGDHAGAHRVDADPLHRDLLGEADDEAVHGALGGGVVDIFVRAAEHRGHRRDGDDGAALAAVLGRHALHRLAGAEDRADHVDVHDAMEAVSRVGLDTARQRHDAGIGDEADQRSEPVGRGEDAEDVGFLGNVALHRDGLGAERVDGGDDLLGRRGIGGVVDHHVIAAPSRQQGAGAPDAAARSGDDDDALGHAASPAAAAAVDRRPEWPQSVTDLRGP